MVGVGSPNGDDVLGLEAIRRLRTRGLAVELCEADSGQRLLDFLDASTPTIIVDALKTSAGNPGTIHRLVWPDSRLESLQLISTHALGVAEALKLAEVLGQLPRRLVIFAVEINNATSQILPSVEFEAIMPQLLQRIEEEIERIRTEN